MASIFRAWRFSVTTFLFMSCNFPRNSHTEPSGARGEKSGSLSINIRIGIGICIRIRIRIRSRGGALVFHIFLTEKVPCWLRLSPVIHSAFATWRSGGADEDIVYLYYHQKSGIDVDCAGLGGAFAGLGWACLGFACYRARSR